MLKVAALVLQYTWSLQRIKSIQLGLLKRISNRLNTSLKKANNKRDFNAAMKAAKKLRGSQRDFVLRSLNQLKKDGSMNVEGKNLLLFGL